MKVCDKTCIFFFFPIIYKYLLMAKRSLLSRCPSYVYSLCSADRDRSNEDSSLFPSPSSSIIYVLDMTIFPKLFAILKIDLNLLFSCSLSVVVLCITPTGSPCLILFLLLCQCWNQYELKLNLLNIC